MAVTLLCPTCEAPAAHRELLPTSCPNCGAAYPLSLQRAASRAAHAERAARPALVAFWTWLLGFAAGVTLFITLMSLLPLGSYTINDEPVTREEFLRRAVPGLLLAAGITGTLFWSMWRERPWSRELFMLTIAALIAWSVGQAIADPEQTDAAVGLVLWAACMLALLGWYFYRKKNVVAYYGRLRAQETLPVDAGDA